MACLDFDMVERGLEDEPGLPRLTVNNMIKELLPDTKVAKDSKDLIINCCSEFIHVVSTEANELAEKSKKAHTLITPDHVIQSLKNLGFTEYISEVTQAYTEFKKTYKKKKSQPKTETTGKTQEELEKEQKELFEQAKLEHIQQEQQEYYRAYQQAQQQMSEGVSQGFVGFPQMPPCLPYPGATQFNAYGPDKAAGPLSESSHSTEGSGTLSSDSEDITAD